MILALSCHAAQTRAGKHKRAMMSCPVLSVCQAKVPTIHQTRMGREINIDERRCRKVVEGWGHVAHCLQAGKGTPPQEGVQGGSKCHSHELEDSEFIGWEVEGEYRGKEGERA